MSGDYTRFTFDPTKGFSGVHKQQGRVSLDSDFNEFEEILDRRSRAEMYDVVGQAVVPLTTRHGFEIGLNAGNLTIGAGRAYVDGILVECFGDMAVTEHDDHLGGLHGRNPLLFEQQPFHYQPEFPSLPASGMSLVYLDVWQREVTVFEEEALREPALNGPDTATRVQTAWQMKVMPGESSTGCASPPAAWTTLTAPTTARLSAQATPAAPAPGPCVINPAGGYTGLENRLYRVEIHSTFDGPKFKWSRDNASLTARITSIAGSIITVSSTGRDAWMRFEPGSHVELLDDFVELAMRDKGKSGTMAKVVSVNHATGEIRVDADLSGFTFDAARHPRIRRWDIADAEPPVRSAATGVPIPLEQGISITFSGGTPRAGDYWVFAARTADGTIETLVNAPPRGVLHHFAKLAVVESATPPKIVGDCRRFWPAGCCCCTIEVGNGSTSQGEFNSIEQALLAADQRVPGTAPIRLCILPGAHFLRETVVIQRSRVTIVGCGPASRVVAPAGKAAFEISGETVRLQSLFLASDKGTEPIIRCSSSAYTTIEGNRIEHYDRGPLVIGTNCRYLSIVDNFLRGFEGLQVQGEALLIERNFLSRVYDDPIRPGDPPKPFDDHSQLGLIDLGSGTKRSRVIANRLERGEGHGITLSGVPGMAFLTDIVIAGNHLSRMRGSGIATLELSVSGTRTVFVYGLRIDHNVIERCVTELAWDRRVDADEGAPQAGIAVAGVKHLVIADNQITGNGIYRPAQVPFAGIYVGHAQGMIVRDNVVTDNGQSGAPVDRQIEGGIVALQLAAPQPVSFFSVPSDLPDFTPNGAALFRSVNLPPFSPLPVGDWPAALVQGNLVVSQSRALTLIGLGPMQVTDNRLVARDLFPLLSRAEIDDTGAALIQANGSSSWTTGVADVSTETGVTDVPIETNAIPNISRWTTGGVPTLLPAGDGNVIFSDNDVVLDRARPWLEPKFQREQPLGNAVRITASHDLAFHDNVIRCPAGSRNLKANTSLMALTLRVTGNGVFEDGVAAPFYSLLLSLGSSGLYTVTGNQVTHCIEIWADSAQGHKVNNVEGPFCKFGVETINLRAAIVEAEHNRQATLARLGELAGSEVESLQSQKAELAKTVEAEDVRLRELEGMIQGAERLRENIELDLRMAERAKEIERGDWALMGRLLDSSGRPIAGARLELFEGELSVTEITADERGEIFARQSGKELEDILARAPQLKVVVKAADGTILQTLEQTLTPGTNQLAAFELRIAEVPSPGPQPLEPEAEKQAIPGPPEAAAPKKTAKKKAAKRNKRTGSKSPRDGGDKEGA